MNAEGLVVTVDDSAGQVGSVKLYGTELLEPTSPCGSELWVNGLALKMRPHVDPNQAGIPSHLKGERFTDHFSGWGLVLARHIGARTNLKHPCVGIETSVRREICDMTLPCPGPGGPVVEAPLFVDTLSVLNWNWQFWGDDTRMIFPSSHSSGPADQFGHVGYENDTPEKCKEFMQNAWRRTYPGVMAVHGGLFYNIKTGHWIAITCRQAHTGYVLNLDGAGRGVSYDFTLHADFPIGEALYLPEIKLHYGETHAEMMSWLGDYVTHYYEEPPEWVFKTLFGHGLAWNNQPTWSQQADAWERELATGTITGVGYSLVTNRPVNSGTTPLGYEPDPNHGTIDEFKLMCRRMADKGVALLTWMSHSGLAYRGGMDIDDDWFIRGVDGRVSYSWGTVDGGGLAHINPGHPGYIEYTKKWVRFYIQECGVKGIFFDCLGWVFPPDYRARQWMRYPGDTNVMAIKFMREIYACIKECDPEAIMLGEGTTLEAPVNIFSIHSNPVRSLDGLGPRDFFLMLNEVTSKRIVIDQGPALAPASGFCCAVTDGKHDEHNRLVASILTQRGGSQSFKAIPGDLSILDNMLFVPVYGDEAAAPIVRLPAPWQEIRVLEDRITGSRITANGDGSFAGVTGGVYTMADG